MAGMDVVIVKCDDHGNIDLQDLRAKAEAHFETLAAIMITYPSTHGVFEPTIREICTKAGIDWHPQTYHSTPKLLSTLLDLRRARPLLEAYNHMWEAAMAPFQSSRPGLGNLMDRRVFHST